MAENNLQRNDHLSPQSMAAFISRTCTDEERSGIEQHCLQCADCRQQLAMISQSIPSDSRPDDEMHQSPNFDSLLLIGEQAAQRVRQQQRMATASTIQAEHPRPMIPEKKTGHWLTGWASAWQWAAVAAVLLVLALPGYLLWQRNQPVTRAMESLRRVWATSRPIEARVTGDFPYLPYQVTRGGNEAVPVNEQELLAATAELAREVADNPSARSRHAMGRLHLLKSEYDRAEEQLKLVIQAEPRNAQAYADLATVHYERGTRNQDVVELSKAAEHLRKATELLPQMTEAWFNLALCHEQMMLFTQAKADWERYLQLDASSKWADEARTHLNKLRARSQIVTPESSKVTDQLLSAEAAKNDEEIRRLLSENFSEVSAIAWNNFLDAYLKAVSSSQQNEVEKYQRVLQRLGQLIQESKGDHYFADQWAFVSRSDPARIRKLMEIRQLLNEGELKHKDSDYDKAIVFFTKARSAAEKIGDVCHAEAAMYGIARIYTAQTETAKMPLLRKNLISIAATNSHLQLQAKALIALANEYGGNNLLSSRLTVSLDAYRISSQIGDTDTATNSLRFAGSSYSRLGNVTQAFSCYVQALRKLSVSSPSSLRICQIYTAFAESLAGWKHYHSALQYQAEALQHCKECNDSLYASAQGRAWKYLKSVNENEEDLLLFHRAIFGLAENQIKADRHSLLFDINLSLGDAYLLQQQFSEAETAYSNALKLIGPNYSLQYAAKIHHGLALSSLPQGKLEAAESALNKSIELEEQARKSISRIAERSTFSEKQKSVYQTMVNFQYSNKKAADRAYDFAEIYRDRELLDLLTAKAEQQGSSRLTEKELSSLFSPLTLQQVQKSLPATVQIVEYALTEQNLLIWVITSDRWLTASVPIGITQLQSLVTDYLNAVTQKSEQTLLNDKARGLYRILIQPVVSHLDKQRALAVIPDGVLNRLPFAALISADNGHYLIEDYSVSVCPSASILARMVEYGRARKRAKDSILILGNPKYNSRLFPSLKPLPAAEEEISRLRNFYPDFHQLIGDQATRKSLLQMIGEVEIAHLATHSIINEENPLLSAIILAGSDDSKPELSNLQAHEIFRLRLAKTRLVILSSCNSAADLPNRHNTLGGLAQAFFCAGVPAVIGSLWEVEDQSTARLMTEFHRAYGGERMNASQALRAAQLSLLHSGNQQLKHPYYWAAFLLSGDGFNA